MNIALWIVQGLLAAVFLMAGSMKSLRKKEDLKDMMPYTEDLSQGQLRAIGIAEIVGALGLILPGLTGIATFLTPLAACGLAIVMIGAIVVHTRRKETSVLNIGLLALAAFVIVGRFALVPLA